MTKRNPQRRMTEAERLQAAEHARIQRLLKHVRRLRARFRELHARGKAALKAHDFTTLGKIIEAENALIAEQRDLVEQQRVLITRGREAW